MSLMCSVCERIETAETARISADATAQQTQTARLYGLFDWDRRYTDHTKTMRN